MTNIADQRADAGHQSHVPADGLAALVVAGPLRRAIRLTGDAIRYG